MEVFVDRQICCLNKLQNTKSICKMYEYTSSLYLIKIPDKSLNTSNFTSFSDTSQTCLRSKVLFIGAKK